jgi:hypothetical protein
MVRIDDFNQTQNNSSQTEKVADKNQTQNKGLLTIIGQCLPLAPFIYEQFTGQKVPQLTGTMAEIQAVLNNLQLAQTQIIQNQQALNQRLTALEANATQHFTNLTNQFQSLRLTHTREQKQIEYNPNPKIDQDENPYV